MRLRARLLAWVSLGYAAYAAADPSSTPLDRYLDGMTSLQTAFTQKVTDAKGKQLESGAGTLLVLRPGRFRWDYQPHSEDHSAAASAQSEQRGQLLVADGKNLWFYDRELAQVTVKPVEAALSATPVTLLSGSSSTLHESFDIGAAGSHDGLDWVNVKPRSAQADFSSAQLGFERNLLARMIVNDRLGQTVQLDFSRSERNAHVSEADLQFKPPAGVDVIGTPQ